jgi:hypothetical protein
MLETYDLNKRLAPNEYKKQLEPLQNQMQALGHE